MCLKILEIQREGEGGKGLMLGLAWGWREGWRQGRERERGGTKGYEGDSKGKKIM